MRRNDEKVCGLCFQPWCDCPEYEAYYNSLSLDGIGRELQMAMEHAMSQTPNDENSSENFLDPKVTADDRFIAADGSIFETIEEYDDYVNGRTNE